MIVVNTSMITPWQNCQSTKGAFLFLILHVSPKTNNKCKLAYTISYLQSIGMVKVMTDIVNSPENISEYRSNPDGYRRCCYHRYEEFSLRSTLLAP